MRMTRNIFLLFVVIVAILSGCATNRFVMKDAMLGEKPSAAKVGIEPYQSLGLRETEAVRTGQTTIVQGRFSEMLFGEYFPGRIRWNVWGVDANGREYFGQALFSGIAYTGEFQETIVMDGKNLDNIAVVVLATGLDFAYNLLGEEIPLAHRFPTDPAYRRKVILEKGTKIGDMKKITGFEQVTATWNKYRIPEGILLSPLSYNDVRTIAGINPQYSVSEKLVATGQLSASLAWHPIYTAVEVGLSMFRASNGSVPSIGWDYNSQIPSRRNMAFIIKYAIEMQQRLVDNLNRVNAECMRKGGLR